MRTRLAAAFSSIRIGITHGEKPIRPRSARSSAMMAVYECRAVTLPATYRTGTRNGQPLAVEPRQRAAKDARRRPLSGRYRTLDRARPQASQARTQAICARRRMRPVHCHRNFGTAGYRHSPYRAGAGTGKHGEPTVPMRVPLSLVEEVENLVRIRGRKLPVYGVDRRAGRWITQTG